MRIIGGTAVLSDPGQKRTCGNFSRLILDNLETFRAYFGVDLFPGSLNVDTKNPCIRADLDAGTPKPAFVIPRDELLNSDLGDGQAWPCKLTHVASNRSIPKDQCWLFRRIGSGVPPTHVELVSTIEIRREWDDLKHNDALVLEYDAK